MMSVQGEPDYLRRAMLAGAREFLVKPFSSDELAASIRQVHQRERQKIDRVASTRPPKPRRTATPRPQHAGNGQVVSFFSPKGGVGRTTLAVNFAVAAKTELDMRVALVDGGLQFGDVGVLLNLNPKNQSIADVAREMAGGDLETLEHDTGRALDRRARADGAAQPGDGRAGHAGPPVEDHRRAAHDARPGRRRLDRRCSRT